MTSSAFPPTPDRAGAWQGASSRTEASTHRQAGDLKIDALLQAADGALYAAKAEGRNRVIIAPPPAESSA